MCKNAVLGVTVTGIAASGGAPPVSNVQPGIPLNYAVCVLAQLAPLVPPQRVANDDMRIANHQHLEA